MPSGSRPVPPPRPSTATPLNTLAGTLADPGDDAWGARVKPEVAALLGQESASHSFAAGWWPREHRSRREGRRIRDNCQRQRAPAPAVGRFGCLRPGPRPAGCVAHGGGNRTDLPT
jgi:hypothetical protein